jgi:purine-binding chemotaxis protein CheW
MSELLQVDGSDSKQFVFSYKNNFYAIRLSIVEEVEETISIQGTPIFDPLLLGMTIYKGLPLPVLDPSKLLKPDESKISKNLSIVILKENDFKIGILMDKFYKILHLPFEKPEQDEVHFLTALSVIENKTLAILNDKEILRHYKNLFKLQIALKNDEDTLTKKNFQKKETEKFIFFTIETLNFGVPIAEVLEVLEGLEVTPLFKVEPFLKGLINLRGKIIPCLDVSVFLDLQPRSINENTKFVILQEDGFEIALCVDSVSKMKEVEKSLIQTTEELLNDNISEYTSGVLQYQKQTLLMISTKNLIHAKDLKKYTYKEG